MTLDRFLVVGVKTTEHEWFALANQDPGLVEAGFDPSVGRSEADLRRQLKDLGLSDLDIDERFRQAKKWMPTATLGPVTKH